MTSPVIKTVTIKIEGRVQGVYFRAWTQQAALALGLDGWVRNRSDGSVEVVFSGPEGLVAEMLQSCAEGPKDAKVTTVTVMDEGGSVLAGFQVLPKH